MAEAVSIQELFISSLSQANVLAQLVIEKWLINEAASVAELSRM